MNHWVKTMQAILSTLLTITLSYAGLTHAENNTMQSNQTGFLVLAADRGFVGNEEIRDAFELFSNNHATALVFVTDERTQQTLTTGLDSLRKKGVRRIVVLPLFISTAEPRYQLARELLSREKEKHPLIFARPYGESY